MFDLNREQGTTLVLVTHDRGIAERCERRITIEAGRIAWSDESPLAAQAHADQRTREAFERIAQGETLERREPKRAYNGAAGVPIREEIVERQGDTVVTRNTYGARCLNTPDVLFVDIDFEEPLRGSLFLFAFMPALIAGVVGGWAARTWLGGLIAFFVVFAVAWVVGQRKKRGDPSGNPIPEKQAAERIGRFMHQHPEWHLRVLPPKWASFSASMPSACA
jgi:hypothetical protein